MAMPLLVGKSAVYSRTLSCCTSEFNDIMTFIHIRFKELKISCSIDFIARPCRKLLIILRKAVVSYLFLSIVSIIFSGS